MNFKIFVDKSFCKIAISHSLNYGDNVKSQKAFKSAIAEYISLYGQSHIDDHESEYSDFFEKAEIIVTKYYTK